MSRTRTAPQQLRAQRTRHELLLAARRAFAELGYDGATIDDIAEAAGCSKGAYYFHFATKEEALLALIDDWTRERSRALRQAAEAPAQRRLDAVLDALFNGSRQEQQLQIELWSLAQRNRNVARRLAKAQREWQKLLAAAARNARSSGLLPTGTDTDALAGAILALHDGLVVQGSLGRNGSARKQVDAVLALFAGENRLRAAG